MRAGTAGGLGPLGNRLAAAFVAVALVALTTFAVITLLTDRSDIAGLARVQRAEATTAIVSSLKSLYRANGGWGKSDLQPVVALADLTGAAVQLGSPVGGVLLRAGPQSLFVSRSALRLTRTLVLDDRSIGDLRLAFPAGGLSPADLRLRDSLEKAAGVSAGLAVLGALAAAGLITRLLVRPLRRLSTAARAVGAGNREVRLGERMGPGELGELAVAFDAMAASLDQQEQLRQAMVADVAHELRTPIAVLQAETEALVDGLRAPDLEAFTSLHDEALRMGRMVEDLQALASADAAGLSLERLPVDLAQVASQAAGALAGRFRSAGVKLEQSLAPAVVRGDAIRLHQVVSNLLANACKFTPAGGEVHLTVGVDGSRARIEVSDTGPGIPPGERDHVFERFYRGSVGRRSGGSGIGLSVVKQLVDAHGGEVLLGTSPSGGACFVVLFPSAAGTLTRS